MPRDGRCPFRPGTSGPVSGAFIAGLQGASASAVEAAYRAPSVARHDPRHLRGLFVSKTEADEAAPLASCVCGSKMPRRTHPHRQGSRGAWWSSAGTGTRRVYFTPSERRDQRAPHAPRSRRASADQLRECRLHPPEVRELGADVHQLVFRRGARLVTVRAVLEPKQASDLVEAETESLRRLHESHACDIRRPVVPDPPIDPARLRQEPLPLIKPYGLDVHASRCGETTNGHIVPARITHS